VSSMSMTDREIIEKLGNNSLALVKGFGVNFSLKAGQWYKLQRNLKVVLRKALALKNKEIRRTQHQKNL